MAAGNASFAAGSQAQANHDGSFVWADTLNASVVTSDRANQFKVRSAGGSRYENGSGLWVEMNLTSLINTSSGTYLDTAGVWHTASDRNLKENFESVDKEQVLATLSQVPVTTWNYRSSDDSVRHMGPVAQDFYDAFGLGETDRAIGTIDTDGVSIVAIQALYKRSLEFEEENSKLHSQVSKMEGRLCDLELGRNGPPLLIILLSAVAVMLLLIIIGMIWIVRRARLLQGITSQNSEGS